MIITKLTGGLGNQMFQYAAGKRAAFINNTILKLDISEYENQKMVTPRKYMLHIFKISENFASKQEIKDFKRGNKIFLAKYFYKLFKRDKPYLRKKYFKEKYFHFNPNILKIMDNTYLEGYWQSKNYFKDIEDVVRNAFTFKEESDGINKKFIDKIIQTDSISIHIRHGDYVSDKRTQEFHGICDLGYYHKAISLIIKKIKNPHFFIFSDDPKWVKKNLYLKTSHVYINHNVGKKDFEDMRLMKLCKHNIIANSSFSWWGAWLNKNPNKIVIAPKKWFQNPEINTDDLISEQWIRL